MSLKFRQAGVVMILMAALVASYLVLLFRDMPERADAETQGALPWVLALLPDQADSGTSRGCAAASDRSGGAPARHTARAREAVR